MESRGFSNSMYVAELRYIQSIHETGELKGPDTVVGQFLPFLRRYRCKWLRQGTITALRADPFYYYLLARTIYYDKLFLQAITHDVRYIINIGCGTDTRAYRFEKMLLENNVCVMECDQPEAIAVKKHMVEKAGKYGHVTYASLDLNDDSWPDFEQFLTQARVKVFVLIEGVSPYVNEEAFRAFLALLGRRLAKGSRVAYDFKLRGVSDTFGLSGRTEKPFRLSGNRQELTEYHDRLGFTLCNLSYSTEILGSKVYAHPEAGTFKEDGLIQLEMT